MKRVFFLFAGLAAAAMVFSAPVSAADKIKVTTVFDKRTVNLNDEIRLSIRISGGQANILRPRIPHVESFESYYTGRTNQFTFVDGQSESVTTFAYVLVPKKAGKYMFPPIEVEVDNDVYKTDPIEIEVLGSGTQAAPAAPAYAPPAGGGSSGAPFGGAPPASSYPSGRPAQQAPIGNVQQPAIPTVTPETDRDIFLNVTADKLEAYPNEQILVNYSIYTRVSTRPEQFEKDPSLNGFWVEEIPPEKDSQAEKLVFGGLQYLKADIKRLALFPTSTGTFEVDSGVFRVTVKKESRPSSAFDEFFDESFFGGSFFARREQKLLTTDPVKIVVRPLPEQGKPADFSGMVGQFTMTSAIDKRSIKQNEPINLTLTIEGQGNIEIMERPKIPEMKDVKVYDSDSSTQLSKTRAGVNGRKTFEVTIIPTAAGDLEIQPITFNYFDPKQGTYQTLRTPVYQIKVAPGPNVPLPESLRSGDTGKELKRKIERESQDIHFIKESFTLPGPISTANLNAGLMLSNVLLSGFCTVFFFRRRYEDKLDRNVAFKRSYYAGRTMQKGLKSLQKMSHSHSEQEQRKFFEEAPKILNAYFADKFNLSAQGLTFNEIEYRLREKALPEAQLESLRSFYEICDQVRFTSVGVPQLRRDELLNVIRQIAGFLEKR